MHLRISQRLALRGTFGYVGPGFLAISTIAAVCRVLFNRRSPRRFNPWRTLFPEDAGTGFTPVLDANTASERNRPRYDHAGTHTLQLEWRFTLADLDQLGHLRSIAFDLLLQLADTMGQSGRFGAGNPQLDGLIPGVPCSDLKDRGIVEGPASIDAQQGNSRLRG